MVTNAYRVAMTLNVGDPIPSIDLFVMGAAGPEKVNTADVLGSGKVVLFAVPGAFTPGCSKVHLPGFVQQASELTGKGVDRIACLSVNDAFVMGAWGDDQQVGDSITNSLKPWASSWMAPVSDLVFGQSATQRSSKTESSPLSTSMKTVALKSVHVPQ